MVVALFNSVYGAFAESFVWPAGLMLLLHVLFRPFISHSCPNDVKLCAMDEVKTRAEDFW